MTAMNSVQDREAQLVKLVRADDRCDRCGVEARVRVVIVTTRLPLLFCGHHYVEQHDALARVAVVTHDERV